MKKLLLLTTLLTSVFLSNNISASGTYIVIEDKSETREIASIGTDKSKTIRLPNRISLSEVALEQLESAREEVLHNRMR
ncbi:hypothetical protein A9Q84_05555 [Halobacteriovorax marinus]|uniref:Secreted protein n=1 Tax=Halobacteriovorax marinus TaxID=97084 RepID=A0A1Y5FB25_9BACT|nr:hypothetical protein A9Q84_05555 [Halobacteriovorax marinus]